ncbi:serine/threonine-protein kinase [Pyxidicoccus xibeiensis]|uniref:serine/threonine-protein kinase n=1 Tax=Pyxidicoccus xibeiensis TaxID=2906759 RepID=UPI0020A80D7B|nr:serine/threonine-protein kinase [Pyxidicoccus xibeiensis]MCP3141551.1 protein kinase [Pyxidicoccus xibeiensis]
MALQPGDRFGRYELVSWLGRGGMAETWRARLMGDAGVTKPVLIKKVLPEFAGDEAFISMFISEARISATLSHGNVAQVFDFGRVEGDYFLAMEYVDGHPLHRIMKRAARSGLVPLPIPLATFIALEMCRGLHYAHTRTDDKGAPLAIVHRDISPDNVLVSYEGQVKIVDFGIAKARSLRTFDTEPGVVKGKYLFFSPEQARGKNVDARTDVWATGLVLYELLCGQRPLSGPPHTVMMRMASGDFPAPRELRKDLPAELNDIVMRALAVDLAGRFESSDAFGDALAGFHYSLTPRFSSMNLAHLLRELFRQELSQEGRELPVPPAFQEELVRWRNTAIKPAPPMAREEHVATPTPRPARRTAVGRSPPPPTEPETRPAPAVAASSSHKPLVMGAAAALAMSTVVGLLAFKQPSTEKYDPSPMRPVKTGLELAPEFPAAQTSREPSPGETPRVSAAPKQEVSATSPPGPLRLDAQRHVILLSPDFIAFSGLSPTTTYTINELSHEETPEPRFIKEPGSSTRPRIFFLLSGHAVSPAGTLGEVSQEGLDFRGAPAISFFTLGPPSPPDTAIRNIQLLSAKVGSERLFAFRPPSRIASVENAALLKGLSPSTVYALTLAPLGEGAFLRGQSRGPGRQVACIQWSTPESSGANVSGWPMVFLLEQGAPVLVKGIDALKCGFVDDDPSDNRGSMLLEVHAHVRSVQPQPRLEGSDARLALAHQSQRESPSQTGADGNLHRALVHLKQRQYPAAIAEAHACLKLEPTHADCLVYLGAAYARHGNSEESARYYRRFSTLHPNHPKAATVRSFLESYDN